MSEASDNIYSRCESADPILDPAEVEDAESERFLAVAIKEKKK